MKNKKVLISMDGKIIFTLLGKYSGDSHHGENTLRK